MRFIPAVSLVRIQLQPPTARWSRGLRHRPFTAVTRVRIPSGSPKIPTASAVGIFTLYFLLFTLGENSTHGCSAVNLYVIVIMEYLFYNITAKAFVIFIGSYVYEFKNRRLAELYCQKNEAKTAMEYLLLAEKYADSHDTSYYLGEHKFKSIFVNRCTVNTKNVLKNLEGTQKEILPSMLSKSDFDLLRDCSEFKELQNRLKKASSLKGGLF